MTAWTWKDLPHPAAKAALERALARWDGTPYRVGQQAPAVDGVGGGVDCVRFVCAVLDELLGRRTPITTLPQDAALHARESAIAAMHQIRKLYLPNEPVEDGTVEPGDLLITAPPGGGPGHALIAGPRRWELWHATGLCVHRTGLGGLRSAGWDLRYVFRPGTKAEWR